MTPKINNRFLYSSIITYFNNLSTIKNEKIDTDMQVIHTQKYIQNRFLS